MTIITVVLLLQDRFASFPTVYHTGTVLLYTKGWDLLCLLYLSNNSLTHSLGHSMNSSALNTNGLIQLERIQQIYCAFGTEIDCKLYI